MTATSQIRRTLHLPLPSGPLPCPPIPSNRPLQHPFAKFSSTAPRIQGFPTPPRLRLLPTHAPGPPAAAHPALATSQWVPARAQAIARAGARAPGVRQAGVSGARPDGRRSFSLIRVAVFGAHWTCFCYFSCAILFSPPRVRMACSLVRPVPAPSATPATRGGWAVGREGCEAGWAGLPATFGRRLRPWPWPTRARCRLQPPTTPSRVNDERRCRGPGPPHDTLATRMMKHCLIGTVPVFQ